MKRPIISILLLILIATAIFVFITFNQAPNFASNTAPVLQCRTQAFTKNTADLNPQTECFSTAKEASVGVVFVKNEKGLTEFFSRTFPDVSPLSFVDSGKPRCAAMLLDPVKGTVKAQCFDSEKELEAAIGGW